MILSVKYINGTREFIFARFWSVYPHANHPKSTIDLFVGAVIHPYEYTASPIYIPFDAIEAIIVHEADRIGVNT